MKQLMALALSLTLTASALAAPAPQDSTAGAGTTKKSSKTRAKNSEPSVADRLNEMQHALDAQQQQIHQLRQEVQSRDSAIQQLQQQVNQAQSTAAPAEQKADTAASQNAQAQQEVSAMKSDVTDLKTNVTNAALSLQDTQKNVKDAMESPMAIHFKGITITPGGFLAAETVWRQHALGSDVNTPFNTIPFSGASQSAMSEFFGTGRQSRISFLGTGDIGSAKISGYVETDFLSSPITANNNESNSYSLRIRQAFGQAALKTGWTFTGGQMWSLITENRKGVENRNEALPMTIDPAYTVGFSWARQYGFRIAKNLNDKMTVAFAVENASTTVGGHGSSPNFLVGQQGASGGTYNPTANYSYNATPDFVGKIAYDPGFGHYEVFGLITDFRDRLFPGALLSTPTATGAYNDSSRGGGAGANARVTVAKHLDAGLHFFGGEGIGRYGTAQLSDVSVRPDGVLAPIRSYQGLATLEWHTKRLDTYFNFGGEYAGRTAFGTKVGYGATGLKNSGCETESVPAATTTTVVTSTTTGTTAKLPNGGATGSPLSNGFDPGALSNCTGDTRVIFEGTVGFWYRLYSGPKGRIQWGPQYSYLSRNTWSGDSSLQPNATENMFLTSFRYYLP
jgi:hypothetical protein